MSSALGDKKGRSADSSDLTRLHRESAVLAAYTTYTGLDVNKKARQQVRADRSFTLSRGGLTLISDSTTGVTRNPVTGQIVVPPYTPTPNQPTGITAVSTYVGRALLGENMGQSIPLIVISGSTIYVMMNSNDNNTSAQFFTLATSASGGTASSYAVSGVTLPILSRMIIGNDNKLYAVRASRVGVSWDAIVYSAPLTTGEFTSFSSLGNQEGQYGDPPLASGTSQSPDGILYFANDDTLVSVSANGASVTTITTIPEFKIGGLVYAKDGYIYASTSSDYGLIKIDPTTGEHTTLVAPGGDLPFLYGIVQGPGDILYGVGLGGAFAITLQGNVTNIFPDSPTTYFTGIAIGPNSALYICSKTSAPGTESVGATYITKLAVTITY